MSVDGKVRAYKFRVDLSGLVTLDCNKISGLDFPRGVITYNDAQGDEVPLTGTKKITNIELHDWDPESAEAYFIWQAKADPAPTAGTITMNRQDGTPAFMYEFYDAIPAGGAGDEADRGSEALWGTTLKLALTVSAAKVL